MPHHDLLHGGGLANPELQSNPAGAGATGGSLDRQVEARADPDRRSRRVRIDGHLVLVAILLHGAPHLRRRFAEIWNGSAWTVTTLPTTTMQSLASVSCVGTDCVAVGSQQLSSGTKFLGFGTLAAEWNGQSWLLDPTSVPGILNSVSCLGVSQCLAVGESEGASGSSGPALAQYFNNGVWSDVSPSTGYLTPLFAVSCVPASVTCSAFESRVAMMVWNASTGTWTASSLPENPFLLVSMSCPTTTWCVATGPSSSYSPVRAVQPRPKPGTVRPGP